MNTHHCQAGLLIPTKSNKTFPGMIKLADYVCIIGTSVSAEQQIQAAVLM